MALKPIRTAYRTFGHLRRLRRIVSVLVRYGMGDLVQRLRLDYWLRAGIRLFRRRPQQEHTPESFATRVRQALQELGPTFIKLGQVLSTRDDLIPADVARELAALQDDVPAESFEWLTIWLLAGCIGIDRTPGSNRQVLGFAAGPGGFRRGM